MIRYTLSCFAFATVVALVSTQTASAEPMRGTYVHSAPDEPLQPGGGNPILFINRYGGTYTPGFNNAVTNRSNIINSTRTIPPFDQGDAAWEVLMDCVRYQFAPFDILVTDVDPSPADHIESVVGGDPSDIGRSDIGGIAPMTNDCSPYDSAVTFNFAEVYGSDMEQLCFTITQESGHAYGMDHQMLCEDPMTYLLGCEWKSFKDQWAQCGEYGARGCRCGGSQQNSWDHMEGWFGLTPDTANPTVNITYPADNGYAKIGFKLTGTATDDLAVARVDFYMDGALIDEARIGPYEFATLQNIELGEHTVELRAYDVYDKVASDLATVMITADGNPPECFTDTECSDGKICYNLQCWDDLPIGGLGETCTSNAQCESRQCGSDGASMVCTESCSDEQPCPEGFDCVAAGGDASVCWPSSGGGGAGGGGGGGCAAVEPSSSTAMALFALMGLIAIMTPRRRRRQ